MYCRRVATAVASLLLAGAPIAQSPLRFDLGPIGGPLATGYVAIGPSTAYSAAQGYGWTAGVGTAFVQPAAPISVPVVGDLALLRDGVDGYGDLTFRADVQNGGYHVTVWLGNLGTTLTPTPRTGLDVSVNGTPVASDLDVRTGTMKAQFINAIGGYRRICARTQVGNGRIELLFHCNGTGESKNSILGIEVHAEVPEPIRFDHGTSTLVAQPAYAAALAPALAAFQAANYPAAKTALATVADARVRAWGQAWLLGWLTDEESEIDDALLASTIALLDSLGPTDDITVRGLRWELAAFERAVFFHRARGYSAAALPGSLDDILKNLNAALLLSDQFRSDLLSTTPVSHLPASPLHLKAEYLAARNMWGRNTGVNDPVGNPFTAAWLAKLVALWQRNTLFPKGHEALVLAWSGANYGIPGGVTSNWSGPGSLPPVVPANTWWAPFVTATDQAAAPAWANAQRRYHRAFRNCGEWWMSRRLLAGELGGGGGDDVEGGGLLGLPAVAAREPGHPLENGAELVLDKVLFGPEMTISEGFFTQCADVEHTAEYSTNPLYILMASSYGSPRYVEYAMRTMRNFDDAFDPSPWTVPDGLGGRQFRAYNIGAFGVCGAPLDIPLNMRAGLPGLFLSDYNAHPGVVSVFDQLARAWASHAVSTAQGKPRGVFPAAVSTAAPHVFGTGGNWWENAGYVDLAGGPEYYAYLYSLLQSAYLRSSAPDRHLLLRPMLLGSGLLYGYLTGTITGTTPGSGGWTANLLKTPMANALAINRSLMLSDPNLGVTPAQVQQIDAVIAAYAAPMERHIALPVVGTKSKTAFTQGFTSAAAWISNFWPIATTTVAYTDRLYAMTYHNTPSGSQAMLFGSLTGASTWGWAPPTVATWFNPDPAAGELDFAALFNDLQPTGLDILLFHYGAAPRAFGLRLLRALPLGQYEVRIGNDANHDDTMDGPPHTIVPLPLLQAGTQVVLPAVPNGVLQKVEIRLLTPATGLPPALPDPAIARADVTFGLLGAAAVVVHNLGTVPVTGALVELVQNGSVVATAPVPTIAAPLDYQAKTATVNLCCGSFVPGALVTVRVVLPPGTAQVTSSNDAVTTAPPGVLTIGAGCAGGNGVPNLQPTSLPAIGRPYMVSVSNLAGGLAVMVLGLQQVTVPLQLLGLGFGPGCTGYLTPDAIELLPQAAGLAQWSLAIPNEPALAGFNLFQQVAELGSPAAVSNAVHAQLH